MAESKEPTLKGLITDLNSLGNTTNNRFAILGLQLYAEHYVNEIVMEQINEHAKSEVRKHLTFPQKLRILKKMKIIDENKKKVLEILNSVRDTYVHELVVSSNEINQKLKHAQLGFNYSWSIKLNNEIKKLSLIDLEKEYKEKILNKYNQLIISSVIIIGILYHNLRLLRGKTSEQFIDVKFVKKDDKWTVNLIVREFFNPKS
ncbi:MAG: hypothetical protein WC548_00095 [Candidatus Pacearchaeota archaeon]